MTLLVLNMRLFPRKQTVSLNIIIIIIIHFNPLQLSLVLALYITDKGFHSLTFLRNTRALSAATITSFHPKEQSHSLYCILILTMSHAVLLRTSLLSTEISKLHKLVQCVTQKEKQFLRLIPPLCLSHTLGLTHQGIVALKL